MFPDHDARTMPVAGTSGGRLRRFRVPVLIVALAVVLTVTRGLNIVAAAHPVTGLLVGLGTAAAAIACYRWLCRRVEGRATVEEVSQDDRLRGLARGGLLGFSLFVTLMLVIGMFGGWEHVGVGSFGGFLISLGTMASVSVNEELLFRGVVFRIMEERLGTVLSLVISSVLFGLTHLVNEHATLWGTLAIGIEGGALTCAAYVATRSLWLPIGIHFAWNFTHAGVFGLATSAGASRGLLDTVLSGPAVLTGGTFGPEASLVALVVAVVPTAIVLRRAARSGRFRPFPRRSAA